MIRTTHARAIRGLASLFIVMPHLVEVILIQLPDKASEIAMLEVLRKDGFGESFVLYGGHPQLRSRMQAWEILPLGLRNFPHHHPIAQLGSRKDLPAFLATDLASNALTSEIWSHTYTVCGPVRVISMAESWNAATEEPPYKVAGAAGAGGADRLIAIHG